MWNFGDQTHLWLFAVRFSFRPMIVIHVMVVLSIRSLFRVIVVAWIFEFSILLNKEFGNVCVCACVCFSLASLRRCCRCFRYYLYINFDYFSEESCRFWIESVILWTAKLFTVEIYFFFLLYCYGRLASHIWRAWQNV